MLSRTISGVFLRNHKDDPEMIELCTMKGGNKTIVWGCVSAEVLGEMRGDITTQDLQNHEYEIVVRFPGGKRQ